MPCDLVLPKEIFKEVRVADHSWSWSAGTVLGTSGWVQSVVPGPIGQDSTVVAHFSCGTKSMQNVWTCSARYPCALCYADIRFECHDMCTGNNPKGHWCSSCHIFMNCQGLLCVQILTCARPETSKISWVCYSWQRGSASWPHRSPCTKYLTNWSVIGLTNIRWLRVQPWHMVRQWHDRHFPSCIRESLPDW